VIYFLIFPQANASKNSLRPANGSFSSCSIGDDQVNGIEPATTQLEDDHSSMQPLDVESNQRANPVTWRVINLTIAYFELLQ